MRGMKNKRNKTITSEQMTLFEVPKKEKQVNIRAEWEKGFQKWCNDMWNDGTISLGKCGFGAICDYCADSGKRTSCKIALNTMLRAKNVSLDYTKAEFEEVWRGKF